MHLLLKYNSKGDTSKCMNYHKIMSVTEIPRTSNWAKANKITSLSSSKTCSRHCMPLKAYKKKAEAYST